MSKLTPLTRRTALAFGGAVALVPVVGRAQPPGTILAGGPIYTGCGQAERIEALAVRGDKIIYVGTLAGAKHAAPGANMIDLAGAAAYPGFVDSHAHLTEIGLREMALNLEGVASIAELQARLRAWATKGADVGANHGPGLD
jgi:predicted amidohydrolase YtcJ